MAVGSVFQSPAGKRKQRFVQPCAIARFEVCADNQKLPDVPTRETEDQSDHNCDEHYHQENPGKQLDVSQFFNGCLVHNLMAMAATRRSNCNHDALAGFACSALILPSVPSGENPVANCTNDGPLNSADNKKGYRTLKTVPRVKNCN